MKPQESAIIKELVDRRMSAWDLTEFDQWANDATRKDINILISQNPNVFGLKMWEWSKIAGLDLKDSLNFSVDLILKNEDEQRVNQLISEYKNSSWKMEKDKKLVDALFDLAVYSCTWV